MNSDNYQRELWRWLQAVTQGQESGPLLFAGFGTSDKFRVEDSLLAAELPASHVFLTSGKHEWPAWRRVLASFLASPNSPPTVAGVRVGDERAGALQRRPSGSHPQ